MNAPPERAHLRLVEDALTEAEVREGLALADLLAAAFGPDIPPYEERTVRNGCIDLCRLILARQA